MSEVTILNSRFWGLPISGSIVRLDNADVRDAISAFSGLSITLAKVAGGILLAGLVVSVLAALRPNKQSAEAPRLNWQQIGVIRTFSRMFKGVCLLEEMHMNCEGHDLAIPTDKIAKYDPLEVWKEARTRKRFSTSITMMDGAHYAGELTGLERMDFITPLGIQSIAVGEWHSVDGCELPERAQTIKDITAFLDEHADECERLMGERVFSKYFQRV